MEKKLSQKEIELLHSINIFEEEIDKQISFALNLGNKLVINIDEELIDDLIDTILSVRNHENSAEKAKSLDKLIKNLEKQA